MMQFDRCQGFSDAAERIRRSEDFLYEAEIKFKFHFDMLKQVGVVVCVSNDDSDCRVM